MNTPVGPQRLLISGLDDYKFSFLKSKKGQKNENIFLVDDHTKFGREAVVWLCNIGEIEALFYGSKA